MKKLALLLALMIGSATLAYTTTRLEIQIRDLLSGSSPEQMRSALKVAEGWIDYQSESIEIEFNVPVGVVDIVITDLSGQPVAGTTIDTNSMSFATLPLPADGMYSLTIVGDDYQGDSNFLIQK